MGNNLVIAGKASNIDLEALHGRVAKVYDTAMEGMESRLAKSTDDNPYVLDTNEISMLKGAQAFLKENDVRMDIVTKTSDRVVRNRIKAQLDRKRLGEDDDS